MVDETSKFVLGIYDAIDILFFGLVYIVETLFYVSHSFNFFCWKKK